MENVKTKPASPSSKRQPSAAPKRIKSTTGKRTESPKTNAPSNSSEVLDEEFKNDIPSSTAEITAQVKDTPYVVDESSTSTKKERPKTARLPPPKKKEEKVEVPYFFLLM